MNRLPIWATAWGSYRLVFGLPLTFLRLAFPALAIVVVLQALAMWLLADDWNAMVAEMEQFMAGGDVPSEAEAQAMALRLEGPGRAMLQVQVVGQLVFLLLTALVATAWLRLAARGDRGNGRWLVPHVGGREIEMIAALFIFMLATGIAFFVAFGLSLAAVSAIGDGGQGVMIVLFCALFLAASRFSLYLAQVACGDGLDPLAAWRLGRGNTLRIFAIYGLVGLPWLAVTMVVQAATAIALLAHIGRTPDAQRAMALMQDIVAPWQAEPEFLAGWLLLAGTWLVLAGGGMALHCAALGLCYAGLRPDRGQNDGRSPLPPG